MRRSSVCVDATVCDWFGNAATATTTTAMAAAANTVAWAHIDAILTLDFTVARRRQYIAVRRFDRCRAFRREHR